MYILTLANNKGGVTKTTSTVNLAHGLARAGRRVLVVDADAQSNATYALSGRLDHQHTLFEALFYGMPLQHAIIDTPFERLWLAPGSLKCSAADLMMANVHGREHKLKRALAPLATHFDYVLIDTPPQLGVLTVNALLAATSIIIPVALNTFALIGIDILETTLQELRTNLEVELPVLGVIATLVDRTNISQDVLAAVMEHFGSLLFLSTIPRNVRVEEAHNRVLDLYEFAPLSTGALAYTQLVQEVMRRAEK